MEIRKIKRNEIPDACRLSHMVYEMAIRRNRPADEQTHKFFYEYMTEENISSCCDSGELICPSSFFTKKDCKETGHEGPYICKNGIGAGYGHGKCNAT